jgi:hypothetical protein
MHSLPNLFRILHFDFRNIKVIYSVSTKSLHGFKSSPTGTCYNCMQYLRQDGAPSHWGLPVQAYLNETSGRVDRQRRTLASSFPRHNITGLRQVGSCQKQCNIWSLTVLAAEKSRSEIPRKLRIVVLEDDGEDLVTD